MKQLAFFAQRDEGPKKYAPSEGSPVYVPKDRRPHVLELSDNSRTVNLEREIEASSVPPEVKRFLMAAAQRHTVFNYELIADFYAHAAPEVQRLVEASALVIVDFDQAIERGYVRLCETIRALHMEEVARDA